VRRSLLLVLVFSTLSAAGCASRPISLAAEGFLPAGPMVRTFAYSRVAPDGSTLLGTLTLAISEVQQVSDTPVAAPPELQTLIRFRADARVFSPEQAKLIDPIFNWPASSGEYPLDVSDIREDYIYRAAPIAGGKPADVALFWTQGMYELLGMPQRPTHFQAGSSTLPLASDALHLTGRFVRHGRGLGRYAFTFRHDHGLSSIAAVLADGTVITLVERDSVPPGASPDPGEPLWFASVTRL
jgi:hypothetical protein